MYLVLAANDSRENLRRELSLAFPRGARELCPGLFACDAPPATSSPWPYLAFARQVVPDAQELSASSIRAWAEAVTGAIAGVLPDHQPWSLQVDPFKEASNETRMGARAWHSLARGQQPHVARQPEPLPQGAGPNRCRLIREAVVEMLQRRRRHLLRNLRSQPGDFGPDEALVQVLLTSPERGFVSVTRAPLPFEQRHVVSCFSGGQVALAKDKQAPSRAFAKLVEVEARMHRRIARGETCVDLGAAPGSWTYVASRSGASVTAVDRSELRSDLMQDRNIRFTRGDAFRFQPERPVDWLLCDVIAPAERCAQLLLQWLRGGWCRRFVVTLKLDDAGSPEVLDRLKLELPALTSELWLMRLCASKREVCAFGSAAPLSG